MVRAKRKEPGSGGRGPDGAGRVGGDGAGGNAPKQPIRLEPGGPVLGHAEGAEGGQFVYPSADDRAREAAHAAYAKGRARGAAEERAAVVQYLKRAARGYDESEAVIPSGLASAILWGKHLFA